MNKISTYRCTVHRSIEDVNADEWNEVCRNSQNLFLDLPFLRVLERSFGTQSEFWYATYRDESDRVVAVSCFSSHLIDIAILAPPAIRSFVASVRRIWSRFLYFRILLGGMPFSSSACYLAFAERAEIDRILASLDGTALSLARKTGCRLISFQQFSSDGTKKMDGLFKYGYRKAFTVSTYELRGEFASFESYLATRKREYRWVTRRRMRRFADVGLTCQQIRGRDGADQLITPEVHQLYLNVLNRAKAQLECKPVEFFRELARQYPDDSHFTFIHRDGRVVAFGCGLTIGRQHLLVSVGFDYSINRETDLYFNLVYRMMERAIAAGSDVIHFGATADEFKRRLGCDQKPCFLYAKATRPIAQWIFNRVFGRLFDASKQGEDSTVAMTTE